MTRLANAARPMIAATGRSSATLLLGILVVAFVWRSFPILVGGGLHGYVDYDDGVYFASTVALVRGQVPYRDFLLVQPPGFVVLASPFALLGQLTSDATGLAAARLAFMLLGACNAVLVAVIASRFGRPAMMLAGLFYAVWGGARVGERSALLPAPQATLLLVALLAIAPGGPVTVRRAAVAGAALGVASSIQAWNVLPLAVVLAGLVWASRRSTRGWHRPAGVFLAAAALGATAVCLPFFLAGPEQMFRMVVLDQLGRPNAGVPLVARLSAMEGWPGSLRAATRPPSVAIYVTAALGVLAVAATAWRVPRTRTWAVLLLVQSGFLLVSPVYFQHYTGWMAPVVALLFGVGAATALGALHGHRLRRVAGAAVPALVIVVVAAASIRNREGTRIDRDVIERDIAGARCVAADSPTLLLVTSALRRDFEAGCHIVFDPAGTSFDTERGSLGSGSLGAARQNAPGYQAAMQRYYAGSDAALFIRPNSNNGLSKATLDAIRLELPHEVKHPPVTVRLRAPPGTTAPSRLLDGPT